MDSTRRCSVEGCEKSHYGKGWCSAHYTRWRRHGDPEWAAPAPARRCAVEGCMLPWRTREWCYMHYQRLMRHGDLNHERTRKTCTIDGCTNYRVSNGWCSKHYARWVRHGSPTARMPGEIVAGCRICSSCGDDKPVSEFYRGRPGRCRKCRAEYQSSPERRAQRRKWQADNSEYMREYMRRYASMRRSRLASVSGTWFTADQLSARMAYFGDRCWMCGGDFEHVDHVKPVSKGGPHLLANLRPSCGRCNRSKSGKWEGAVSAMTLAR